MAEYHPVPSTYLSPLERPRCPRCVQARMLLSKVEAGPSGFDRRTFEWPEMRSRSHADCLK
jgi:hypothetical protein